MVTVLFADIVGFTTMSETRDPEHVKNLVDSWFARLATDVTNHGGRVDKTIGDAMMAIFGAPVAHEDDAERAVRGALAMQKTVAELAASAGMDVRLRVGVNTGEVLIGAMRAGGDFTAMGDTVNVASRLQTSADPGTVVVGPATYHATNGVIGYTDLLPLHARGREEKVSRWVAEAPLVMPGRRASQRRSPLVGRDNEVALLRAMLSTSLARSRPSVALMYGEPGVGKTRLAEEVCVMARNDHDALVLEGRCVPYGEANVWWPVAEAVRQACGLSPDCDRADDAVHMRIRQRVAEVTGLDPDDPELDRLVAGLVYVLGDPNALGDIDVARAPSEVRRAVEALIQGLARQQPLMIALAELHWADDLVLRLVDDLLERAGGLPVFVLATARPDLEKRWTPPAGRHNAVSIHLDPLDEAAAAQMLQTLLGAGASQEMMRLVMERAGGNPLFLEELAGLLTEVPDGGATVSDLPATLRGLVAARIDSLDPAERNILDDAAVIGRDGRVDALAALAASRGTALDETALDELIARELLEEDAGAWSFRSELVREVAYDTLTKADRARRHAALGVWLTERRRSQSDDELEPIAHHLSTAALLRQSLGDIAGVPADICPRALRAIEKAAMAAKDRGLHSGSIFLLDRALDLLDPSDRANRHRSLLARASAYATLRLVDKGLADVEAVAAELGEDEPATWANVEMIRGELRGTGGHTDEAITALEHALGLWRQLGDAAAEAKTLRLMGMTYLFAGDNVAADRLLNEALAAFRSLGDRQGEAWALQNRAWLSFNQGLLDEADERLREAEKTFVDIGDFGGLGFVRGLLGFVRMFQGRFEEAGELAEYILANERDRNDKWALGMILLLLSSVKLFTGKPDEALAPATEAIELFTAMGDAERMIQAQATRARALVAVGRIDEATQALRDLFEPEENGSPIGLGVISAAVASQLGEPGLMTAALGQPVQMSLTMGTVADHETGILRGVHALLSGDASTARKMLQQSADASSNEGQRAYAYAALAVAAAADRDPKFALVAADKSLDAQGGTYLDAQLAKTAQALAFAQQDDRRALVVAEEVVRRANDTTDVLTQATSLLLRASVACALRTDDAVDQAADADQALEALGADLPGWRDVFAAAATPVSRLEPA
ncbi:MAG TPA: adenylate/guanylate cyclase domain-containing protein [Acidimicrobiales bacterium]|nr:adenylate/guanylate cyclase domain-containing protein [Acidimicrobiales bacterium]